MNYTALQSAVSIESLAMLSSVVSKHGDYDMLAALAGIFAEMGKPETARAILIARTEALVEDAPIAAKKVSEAETHQKKLEQAFDRVKDPRDWKAPIAANVLSSQLDITCAAITHFTATTPRFFPAGFSDGGLPIYHVTSPGYRAGPAGDH